MAFNPQNRGSTLAEINITPLVDVMLVLLIIFMVTAPLLEQGISVDLPAVTSAPIDRSERDVIVTLDREGRMYLMDEKTAYPPEVLLSKLPGIFANRDKKEVYLRADREVPYGKVAEAISLFKESGIERVGMVTEASDTPGSVRDKDRNNRRR